MIQTIKKEPGGHSLYITFYFDHHLTFLSHFVIFQLRFQIQY